MEGFVSFLELLNRIGLFGVSVLIIWASHRDTWVWGRELRTERAAHEATKKAHREELARIRDERAAERAKHEEELAAAAEWWKQQVLDVRTRQGELLAQQRQETAYWQETALRALNVGEAIAGRR